MTGVDPERFDENVTEKIRHSLEKSAFGAVTPGTRPTARDVWAALGGPRGLVESLTPGVMFLVVYSLTTHLVWSVGAPLAVAIGFVIVRILQKQPIQPALAGVLGIAASAAVAILSGSAANYFSLGLWVNVGGLLAMITSLVVRRPFVGVVSAILVSDLQWRSDPAVYTMAKVATWLWVGLFSARLAVQTPLYLVDAVQQLAMARLVMGVPLYALVLWLTWLLMRSVYRDHEPSRGAKI